MCCSFAALPGPGGGNKTATPGEKRLRIINF
jgi:hypothetical protein